MRILIIGPGKLKYMPYAHFYLDNIDQIKNEVHIAYWNRDEKEEDVKSYSNVALHEFKCFMVNDAPLRTKLKCFFKYRQFCVSILKKFDFDFVIVLHSLTGLMIYDILTRKYKELYILDYRDSTYESKSFFRYLVGELVKCSYCTFVSSDAFRKFLPDSEKKKTYTSHNLLEDSLKHRDYEKTSSNRIRVAFWGFIRHVDINKKLIDRIASDNRFELHYYGREQKDAIELKHYVLNNYYKNVFFHGEYNPNDRYEFVKSTDIIDNIYLDSNTFLAMGNKYYDGIIFRIPQVCMVGSYMSQMSQEHGVGCSLDPRDEEFTEKLFQYYNHLDGAVFIDNCDIELNRIMEEYYLGRKILRVLFYN